MPTLSVRTPTEEVILEGQLDSFGTNVCMDVEMSCTSVSYLTHTYVSSDLVLPCTKSTCSCGSVQFMGMNTKAVGNNSMSLYPSHWHHGR